MKYEIKGGSFPVVELTLNKDDRVVSEAGAMCWRDPSFVRQTNSNGGFEGAVGRLFMGESLFLNYYTPTLDNSKISFSSSIPGSIKAIELKNGESIICQKNAFLCGLGNINLSIHLNHKAKVGLFGGEGFILEKISGEGIVFLEIDGSDFEYVLEENQRLVIDTGHLVSVSETCQIDVQSNKGLKDIFMSGEGFFNTVVIGPGKVIVQSMPVTKLARGVNPYISHPEVGK